jgi:FkbM family methyltransferase
MNPMNPRPVNTKELFLALLPDLGIDLVCEVGSMNGADALAFRARLPQARIIALEPNPSNLERMRADPRLAAAGIEIVGAAASNADANAPFFVVEADYSTSNARRGMSSLHRRDAAAYLTQAVDVPTLRLDSLLAPAIAQQGARIALWVDVEGHACEVLEGLRGIAPHVVLLHVELETQPCVAAGQRLYPEALSLLEDWDFDEIATDQLHTHPQLNAIFLRRELDPVTWLCVGRRLRWAQVRSTLVGALGRVCPGCRRRLGEWQRRLEWRQVQRRFSKQPARESAT